MKKKALVLINTGTPGRPHWRSVYVFLTRFLNDPRVVDLPLVIRKILVNLVIVPLRACKSAKLYRKIWTQEGSPLLVYMERLVSKLDSGLKNECDVFGAMRYGEPFLENVLSHIRKGRYREIIVVPLFPQYASSTTGSALEKTMKIVQKWEVVPSVRFVSQFYSHPSFIKCFAANIAKYDLKQFSHIVFSFHSLPLRHIEKVHPGRSPATCNCTGEMPEHGTFCYKAACYETARLISREAGLENGGFTVSFQSRFAKNWISPFTDEVIRDLALNGHKKILVVSPSFVADCLETLYEISVEYSHIFKKHGGRELVMAESLNDKEDWVEAITEIAGLSKISVQ